LKDYIMLFFDSVTPLILLFLYTHSRRRSTIEHISAPIFICFYYAPCPLRRSMCSIVIGMITFLNSFILDLEFGKTCSNIFSVFESKIKKKGNWRYTFGVIFEFCLVFANSLYFGKNSVPKIRCGKDDVTK
jgi:hypothetical protein